MGRSFFSVAFLSLFALCLCGRVTRQFQIQKAARFSTFGLTGNGALADESHYQHVTDDRGLVVSPHLHLAPSLMWVTGLLGEVTLSL
jgi:hypothetical protein